MSSPEPQWDESSDILKKYTGHSEVDIRIPACSSQIQSIRPEHLLPWQSTPWRYRERDLPRPNSGIKEHRGAFRKHHGLCSVTRNKVGALGSSSADLRKQIAEITRLRRLPRSDNSSFCFLVTIQSSIYSLVCA